MTPDPHPNRLAMPTGEAGTNEAQLSGADSERPGAQADAGLRAEPVDATLPPARTPGGSRAEYLVEVSGQLWPDPATVSIAGTARRAGKAANGAAGGRRADVRGESPVGLRTVDEFVVLPGLTEPRLLVPLARRPAAGALRRYGKPNSLKARLATQGLSLVFRSGLGRVMLRDRLCVRAPSGVATIESYLSGALGLDVIVSLYMGSARANRKPVLQLLSTRGETIGYAKVGVNELTTTLVGVERDALDKLGKANLKTLTVPQVLHYGSWQDLTVLVLSPLPVWLRNAPLPERSSGAGDGRSRSCRGDLPGSPLG